MLILLMLLSSHAIPAIAMSSDTIGRLYNDAIFELEKKLALWERLEEDIEARELERIEEVFAELSGPSAQYSKGFRQYIGVLIDISSEHYASVDDLLYLLNENLDFCKQLEMVHKEYVHIGTIEQLSSYATGRKKQYLGEETANSLQEELQYYQEAVEAYDLCNGWLDSAKRYLDLKGFMLDNATPVPTPMPTPSPDQSVFDLTFTYYKNGIGRGSCPIYTAPKENAYRIRNANGRETSCDTNYALYVAGSASNGWLLIQYETNNGNMRVGYIPSENLRGFKSNILSFDRICQNADKQIPVTDNPANKNSSFAKLAKGDTFYILGEYSAKDDWWYIECAVNGKTARGFILKEMHAINPDPDPDVPITIDTITVDGYGRIVRKDAGTEYEEVIKVNDGETYSYYDSKPASNGVIWYYINVNGKWGWISSGVLR